MAMTNQQLIALLETKPMWMDVRVGVGTTEYQYPILSPQDIVVMGQQEDDNIQCIVITGDIGAEYYNEATQSGDDS